MQASNVSEGWLRTAELDFGVQEPPIPLLVVADYLKSAFGIDHSKLDAFFRKREESSQAFRLVFRSNEEHRNFIDEHAGTFEIQLGNNLVNLRIYDASIAFKIVRIVGLPPYVDLQKVESDMTQYGVIQKIEWQHHLSKTLEKVKTDTLKVQIILSEPIPWFIQVDSRKVRASYEGQVKTCSLCNSEEHLKKNCPQLRKRKAAEFYDSNFPALGTPRRVKQNPWFTVGKGGTAKETENRQGNRAGEVSNLAEKEILDLVDLTVTNLNQPSTTATKPKVSVLAASKIKVTGRQKSNAKQLRDKESRDLERNVFGNQMTGTEVPYIDVSQNQTEQASDIISDPLALAQLISEVQNAPESLIEIPTPSSSVTSVGFPAQDRIEAGQRFKSSENSVAHTTESQASDLPEDMDFTINSLKKGRIDESPPDQPVKKRNS